MIKVTFPCRWREIKPELEKHAQGFFRLDWNGFDWCEVSFEYSRDAIFFTLKYS
jgi:hypothetical protein